MSIDLIFIRKPGKQYSKYLVPILSHNTDEIICDPKQRCTNFGKHYYTKQYVPVHSFKKLVITSLRWIIPSDSTVLNLKSTKMDLHVSHDMNNKLLHKTIIHKNISNMHISKNKTGNVCVM